jgi:hypothetical protein
MKSIHGLLHGALWIRVHGLPEFVASPPPRGAYDENSGMTMILFNCSWQIARHIHNIFQGWQAPPIYSPKLRKFETYYIKSNPPSFFLPTKYAMVPQHGPFSLYTMLEGPWLHITAFPTHVVQPLDESQGSSPLQCHSCVKWPLVWIVIIVDHIKYYSASQLKFCINKIINGMTFRMT